MSNVTLVRGFLEKLSPSYKMIGKDLEGEAGLDFEKWEKVSDCLVRDIYNVKQKTLGTISEFVSSNSSFDSIFRNKLLGAVQVNSSHELDEESSKGFTTMRSLPDQSRSSSIFGKPSSSFFSIFQNEGEVGGIFASQLTTAKINNSPGR